jgi:hypothetical protein
MTGLSRWLRLGRGGATTESGAGAPEEDPLLAMGRRLRQERESRGLNLRQLALETRISTPVLEALERGWRDRLPEGAYLRTMLPLIEQHLDLPAGSLDVALPPRSQQPGNGSSYNGLLQRFTPGSIDVFSSWQGTVLYGLLTLGLIYGLNLQLRQLASENLLSLQPIPALPPGEQNRPPSPGTSLLAAFPELRPLQQAGRGTGLRALQSLETTSSQQLNPGVLELNLSQASRVDLRSEGGERSQLQGAQGVLVLQLRPPLQLAIAPAPQPGEVLWNGAPLAPLPKQPGQFKLPPPPAKPQTPPAGALSAGDAAPSPPAPAAGR